MKRRTTREFCPTHGHQEFFLGAVWDLDTDEYCCEALHCPHCWPDHEDNPANSGEVLWPNACSVPHDCCTQAR